MQFDISGNNLGTELISSISALTINNLITKEQKNKFPLLIVQVSSPQNKESKRFVYSFADLDIINSKLSIIDTVMLAFVHKSYGEVYLLLDDEAQKNTSAEKAIQFFSSIDNRYGAAKSATLNGFTIEAQDTIIKFEGILKRESTNNKIEIVMHKSNSNKVISINI